jgi:hypothetical protein
MGVERERLERAYDFGLRLLDGWRPGPADLTGAPTISQWEPQPQGGGLYSLAGKVTGHPRMEIGRSPQMRTSAVIWLDPAAGWARTIGRFYLLGPPRTTDQALPGNEALAVPALAYIWVAIRNEQSS